LRSYLREFQCSSASRKFLNLIRQQRRQCVCCVSVLFSEPKIPQSFRAASNPPRSRSFSALQRAENSSIFAHPTSYARVRMFQCSSASRKFLNFDTLGRCALHRVRFSALQRAENSSIGEDVWHRAARWGFSALQRAENSSISCATALDIKQHLFQCSSASRKFLNASPRLGVRWSPRVSVLFSEPKIPQSFFLTSLTPHRQRGFSALQRAENSSMRARYAAANVCAIVSVLFSEPKIPQSTIRLAAWMYRQRFSALQRAENSSMALLLAGNIKAPRFQCSSASRKFLNRNPADVDR